MYQNWMWLLISNLILKIIGTGISRGHLLSGLYVILICILAHTLISWPTPVSHYLGLWTQCPQCHTCIQPRHVFTSVSVFLCLTPPPPLWLDPSLTTFGRPGETSRGVCGGLDRPETGKRTSKSASNPKAFHKSSKWALVWGVKHTCKTYVSLIKP